MSRLSSLRLPHERLIFLFSFFIFFASHALADEKENPCAKSLLNLDPPPLIQEVKIQPENPKESEDVLVRAAIGNDSEKIKAVTTNAWLHYSTDNGKTETVIEMQKADEKDTEDFGVWTGKIPAQKMGTSVVYYVSAKDSNGHYSTETPGESGSVKFPPEEGKETGIKFSAPVPDEECPSAEGGLDIMGFSVGYDEKTLYGKITMRDRITKGTTQPISMSAIAVGFLNPHESENIEKSTVLIWLPLLQEGIWCEPCYEWFVVNERTKITKMPLLEPETGAVIFVNLREFYLKINRSLFGSNPSETLKIYAFAGLITSFLESSQSKSLKDAVFSKINPILDATPHMVVYLRTHAYTVK